MNIELTSLKILPASAKSPQGFGNAFLRGFLFGAGFNII